MSSKRKKAPAIEIPVPQDDDACDDFIKLIGDAQSARDSLQADLDRDVRALKSRYEDLQKPHVTEIDRLSQGVQIYCEANRKRLTREGKIKTHMFGSGAVSWRMRPASVSLRGVEEIIKFLKGTRSIRLRAFLRTKVEIDKEAMLKEQDLASTITGVKIKQGEDFVIKPLETKLEESIPTQMAKPS